MNQTPYIIGQFALTNFNIVICLEMEMHPGWRNDKMLEACKKNGIHVTVRFAYYLNNKMDVPVLFVDYIEFRA